jgi:hypothetical protein
MLKPRVRRVSKNRQNLLGFSKDHTTMILTLASSTANSSADNNVSLLGLVTKAVGLFGSSRSVAGKDVGALTVFPGANTKQKSKGVRLLVAPQLFHVLVGSHGVYYSKNLL